MIKTDITLNGTTPSAAIDLRGQTIMRIELPATWTTSDIGLLESFTADGTFKLVYDDEGNAVTFAGSTGNRVIRCDERIMQHARFAKLYSIVSQGAARAVVVQVVSLKEVINGTGLVGS
jgi:sugar lactone lactonase YvrE